MLKLAARLSIALGLLVPTVSWAYADEPSATRTSARGGPAWEKIAKAPIAGRISAGVVWNGEEMIVWGGVTRSRTIEAVSDGAAFDPATGRWREISSSPHGVLGGGGDAAAWTGRRAVFWAGNSPDGPARGAVYNPATDHWRKLPRGPLGPREGYVSVWTGDELLIMGGTSGDTFSSHIGAAVDPAESTWRRLRGIDDLNALIPSGAVWDGSRVFLAGTQYLCPNPDSTCQDTRPIFVAYDPASDELEEIDLAGAPAEAIAPVAWTGAEVLAVGQHATDVVLFDPVTGTWREAAASACPADTSAFRQHAWIGDRYVATCGRDALQVYDLASDAWEVVEAGKSPFNTRADSAIVWTGTELVVWSGLKRSDSSTPNTGMAIVLP
jgi:hypothetical protein